MKKNALLEAAAEILKQSQGSAPKEELHKVEGDVQDLGGSTPQANVDKKLDVHAKEATPPGQQPGSDKKEPLHKVEGGAKEIDPLEQGAAVEGDAATIKSRIEAGLAAGDLSESWKKSLKEDVAKIVASESGVSQEFAAKVGTIYEARVSDKVAEIVKTLEEKYNAALEEAVQGIQKELTASVNDYLGYVVEQWMQENELAIEKGIRSELTEEFIEGLRNLFAEHYIDIPSEKVDLVEELATKVEELSGQLNEQVGKNVDLQKKLTEAKKQDILKSVCEGLTQTQAEKVKTLAESVEFAAEGEYTQKVQTIRENYFPVSAPKKVDAKVLTEAQEPIEEEKKPATQVVDPEVAAVEAAIKKFFR